MEQLATYWNETMTFLQDINHVLNEGGMMTRHIYDTHIAHDWQLQGSCVLVLVFLLLCVLVNSQWNTYGQIIMGVDAVNPSSSTASSSYAHSNEHVNTAYEVFPDEDPLTFTKKTK